MKYLGNIFTVFWVPGYHPRYLIKLANLCYSQKRRMHFWEIRHLKFQWLLIPF